MGGTLGVALSQGLPRMIQVMAWILRSQRSQRLRFAASVSISVDDRGDFRIVRYRCSYDSLESFAAACQDHDRQELPTFTASSLLEEWCSVGPLVHEGVLAVIRSGGNVKSNTVASHDQDKSERMADTVIDALRQSCADVDNNIDEDLFTKVSAKVQHYVSDQGGSAHKCGQLLSRRPELGNLVWVSCDAAHQVRIASKDPLHANDGFRQQWDRLFNAKHALIPDIQNSDVWRSRLVAAQKVLHRAPAGPAVQAVPAVPAAKDNRMLEVDTVMRTFSFAKQRFDSSSTPMMKYCCILRATALVCAMQAADVSLLDQNFQCCWSDLVYVKYVGISQGNLVGSRDGFCTYLPRREDQRKSGCVRNLHCKRWLPTTCFVAGWPVTTLVNAWFSCGRISTSKTLILPKPQTLLKPFALGCNFCLWMALFWGMLNTQA